MQKIHIHTQIGSADNYMLWKVITAVISFATTITIFNIHIPKHSVTTAKADLHTMFERESEVLHMHPNYGARARYSTILGSE